MLLTVVSEAGLTASDLKRLTMIVEKSISCSDLPGLALSVVGNGQVLLEQGYGVADLETGAPVTVDTLFPLGSATKAFTTSLMALLIDKHSNSPTRLVCNLVFVFRLQWLTSTAIFDLTLTPMSESVHISPVVLLNPGNVGV